MEMPSAGRDAAGGPVPAVLRTVGMALAFWAAGSAQSKLETNDGLAPRDATSVLELESRRLHDSTMHDDREGRPELHYYIQIVKPDSMFDDKMVMRPDPNKYAMWFVPPLDFARPANGQK